MALSGGKRRETKPVSFDSEAVSIGNFLTLTTGAHAIAFGSSAVAGANTMIVGNNTNTAMAIHQFSVQGYNGSVLDTISAVDNPTDGCFGLSVVYNVGGTYSNKTIKGAVTPPTGAILLYADP